MNVFCTYFDSNYLDRGLCLWRSLTQLRPDARLFVCCLDHTAYDVMQQLSPTGTTIVPLAAIEGRYEELVEAKATRSRIEYYFTLTPSWIRFVLETCVESDTVTYLDSDLLFFADPQPLFEEMERRSGAIAIIPHRFTAKLEAAKIHGLYNVGWITFSRHGQECLLEWQRQCIDWCYDRVDGERFADQKYLDAWPQRYDRVVVLEHKGANVALWNLEPRTVQRRGDRFTVYGQDLIFYHFHGLSQIGDRTFFTNARTYGVNLDRIVRHDVYGRYITMLRQEQRRLRRDDVQPLIRYKHRPDDLAFAQRHPFCGLFLYNAFGLALP